MTLTLQEIEQALKEDPRSRLFFQLAGEYKKMGKFEEARALLEKGLGFFPNHVDARLLLAQIYVAAANLEGAKSMVDRVLLVVPDHIYGNHLAADIYHSMGNQELALKHYRIVELFEPGRPGVTEKLRELTGEQAEEPDPKAAEEPSPGPFDKAQYRPVGVREMPVEGMPVVPPPMQKTPEEHFSAVDEPEQEDGLVFSERDPSPAEEEQQEESHAGSEVSEIDSPEFEPPLEVEEAEDIEESVPGPEPDPAPEPEPEHEPEPEPEPVPEPEPEPDQETADPFIRVEDPFQGTDEEVPEAAESHPAETEDHPEDDQGVPVEAPLAEDLSPLSRDSSEVFGHPVEGEADISEQELFGEGDSENPFPDNDSGMEDEISAEAEEFSLPESFPRPAMGTGEESEAGNSPLSTNTLAELYEMQGYPEKAIEIYQRLLLRSPEDRGIKKRIQELMRKIEGAQPEGEAVAQEEIQGALRQRRIRVLRDWLRRVKEDRHVS